MKNKLVMLLVAFVIASCKQAPDNSAQFQSKINEVQKKLDESYKPGLSDIMSALQKHHSKLYFAGENNNWKLAEYEIKKIMGSLEDISKYCADREESKLVDMLQAPIGNISKAITEKNTISFKTGYELLTNTCNNCHRTANHGFILAKIPGASPFSNQEFKSNE